MHRTTSSPSASPKSTLSVRYKKTVLPNGIRVVTEQIPHVRSVSIGFWFNVGSRDEDVRQSGISHFIEHMVFKGTKHYRAAQIARSLESVGGYLNAFTSKETTCFYAQILDQHVAKAIDVLSEMIQYPLFASTEVEKEKQVVLEELKNIEDDPDELIHDYFDRLIFGNHPLASPVIGRTETIMSFDRQMLVEYMREHYQPSAMVVAAAGNISHDQLLACVDEHVRRSTVNRRNGVKARPDDVTGRLRVGHRRAFGSIEEHEKPISQAHICMGTLAFSMKSRFRYPLLVLNTLLGEGMSSRLFQNIREKYGFAYNVYSFANTLSDTGTFGVYIGTDKQNIGNSIELTHKELGKLREKPVSRAELQRTKEQLKGTMMLSLESTSSRMMRLGTTELCYGEYIALDSIIRNIDAVTQDHVHEVATRLFDEASLSTVIFKPSESVTNKAADKQWDNAVPALRRNGRVR